MARLIALVFAGLFIAFAALALFLFNVDGQLLHPEMYKRVLAEQRIYDRLPALAGEMLARSTYNPCVENPSQPECELEERAAPSENPLYPVWASPSPQLQNCLKQTLGEETMGMLSTGKRWPKSAETDKIKPCLRQYGIPAAARSNRGGMPLQFWMLDPSDWETIFSTLLPPAWLQAQVEGVLDQLFAYFDYKTDEVEIPLVDVKTRLTGDDGVAVLSRIIKAQPPCDQKQLEQWKKPWSSADDIEFCRPSDALLASKTPEIRQTIRQTMASLPDQATLLSSTQADGRPSSDDSLLGSDPRQAFGRVRLFLRIMMIVPAVFFLLMTLFGVRSVKGLLRWWGVPHLIVGLIAGGMALMVVVGTAFLTSTVVPERLSRIGMPLNSIQTIQQIVQPIGQTFAMWSGIQAALVLLLGLILLSASFMFKGPSVGSRQTPTAVPGAPQAISWLAGESNGASRDSSHPSAWGA